MNTFWSSYVILLVLANIIGYALFLYFQRKMPKDDEVGTGEKLKHSYDGITELNNPLPRWWFWFFCICIVFSAIYLSLYPGLGAVKGYLHWSQTKQWQEQQQLAQEKYGPLFAKLGAMPLMVLSKNEEAMRVGERLFVNNCAVCHGPNGKGAKGFPNLTDRIWLFGGTPELIETSISQGRMGIMPPMGQTIGGEPAVKQVAQYVLQLSGQPYDKVLAAQGEKTFKTICSACHGVDGKGNQTIGSPNLTENSWLFGGSVDDIEETIRHGRQGQMPAHEPLLGKDKVHILAAYVYLLSHQND